MLKLALENKTLAIESDQIVDSPVKAIEAEKKDDTMITDLSTSITTPATAVGGSQTNIQVAMLNQKIEELQNEKAKVEDEKKLADEEISQLNKTI